MSFIRKHKNIIWDLICIIVILSLGAIEGIFINELFCGKFYLNHPILTSISSIVYVSSAILSGYFGYIFNIFKEKEIPLWIETLAIIIPVVITLISFIPKIITNSSNYEAAMVSVIFSPIAVIILIGETVHSNKEDNDIDEIKNHLYMKVYIIGNTIIYIPDHINPKHVKKEFWLLGGKSEQKKSKAERFFKKNNITHKEVNEMEILSRKLH